MSYLVLDRRGVVLHVTEDPHAAAALAARRGPFQWLAPALEPEPLEAAAANPPRTPAQKAISLAGLGLVAPLDQALVEAIPVKAAHAAIRPFFEEARAAAGTGRGLVELDDMLEPARGLLGQNTKLSKRDRSKPASVSLGLNLMPEHTVFRGVSEGGVDVSAAGALGGRPGLTLCLGSSAACRASCLVYSGQNQSDVLNNFAKVARTKALLVEPHSFVRVLLKAIDRYSTARRIDGESVEGATKFLRLNVLSDIPWELLVPWLPHYCAERRIGLYDYTKVHGRDVIPNYDLSFSYSGTNLGICDDELRRNRRVVVVFAAPDYLRAIDAKRKYHTKAGKRDAYYTWNPIPQWIEDPGLLNGERILVVDGDRSDIRPFDPPQCVVALRWKPPRVKGREWVPGRPKDPLPKYFVVAGEVVETSNGRIYKLPETPLSRPGSTS